MRTQHKCVSPCDVHYITSPNMRLRRWGIRLSEHEKAEITEVADRVDVNTRKPSQVTSVMNLCVYERDLSIDTNPIRLCS